MRNVAVTYVCDRCGETVDEVLSIPHMVRYIRGIAGEEITTLTPLAEVGPRRVVPTGRGGFRVADEDPRGLDLCNPCVALLQAWIARKS